jgi:hypothetical protein
MQTLTWRETMFLRVAIFFYIISGVFVNSLHAWFDETHLAVAKVAGFQKWFKAAGADIAKQKMSHKEGHNHFVNNPRGTVVTPKMVLAQVEKYNHIDRSGHLYGAIIASVRDDIEVKRKGAAPSIILRMPHIKQANYLYHWHTNTALYI